MLKEKDKEMMISPLHGNYLNLAVVGLLAVGSRLHIDCPDSRTLCGAVIKVSPSAIPIHWADFNYCD